MARRFSTIALVGTIFRFTAFLAALSIATLHSSSMPTLRIRLAFAAKSATALVSVPFRSKTLQHTHSPLACSVYRLSVIKTTLSGSTRTQLSCPVKPVKYRTLSTETTINACTFCSFNSFRTASIRFFAVAMSIMIPFSLRFHHCRITRLKIYVFFQFFIPPLTHRQGLFRMIYSEGNRKRKQKIPTGVSRGQQQNFKEKP